TRLACPVPYVCTTSRYRPSSDAAPAGPAPSRAGTRTRKWRKRHGVMGGSCPTPCRVASLRSLPHASARDRFTRNHDLHAPVHLAAGGVVVGRDGPALAESEGGDRGRR